MTRDRTIKEPDSIAVLKKNGKWLYRLQFRNNIFKVPFVGKGQRFLSSERYDTPEKAWRGARKKVDELIS